MGTNKYNKKITMGRIKLNCLLDWAYNVGKNDDSEFNYKRLRDEMWEKMKLKQNLTAKENSK